MWGVLKVRGKPEERFSTPGFHKRSIPMKYVGVDLHKKSLSICVVVLV